MRFVDEAPSALDRLIAGEERTRLFFALLHDDGISDVGFVSALRILILELDPIPGASSVDSIDLKKVPGRAADRLAALLWMGDEA